MGASITWKEYISMLPRIRYIEGGAGEINFYRLIFGLNDLGKSSLQCTII